MIEIIYLYDCARITESKPIVLVHEYLIVARFGEVGGYIFAAELYPVAYAFALARELGYS